MTGFHLAVGAAIFLALIFVLWRRYLWVARTSELEHEDTCPYSLKDVFGSRSLRSVPHQAGARWLTEIYSRSAARYPHHVALQIARTGESLTYAELDARAEAVAAALSPILTGPDQVVAVALGQDDWHIVAAHLGILKAGGTVLVLDATLPDAVVAHMLADAKPVVVLTRGPQGFHGLRTLDMLALPGTARRCVPAPWLDDPAQRLASIFYTSGTTGRPKGVECSHAGYVNLALSYADYFDLVPGQDATSLTSSLGYDGSISEMYSAWVSGCTVVLLTREQLRSGPELAAILRESEVTVLFCAPALLATITPAPELDLPYPVCRYIVPAGEAFPPALVEPWTRGRRQIINTYGPTEASTDTSRQSLRPGAPVTIGFPFPNVCYVILAVDELDPLPHGEAGELCIGGVHVARGYRNLPEETARKFIVHPRFGRLYRTGDRCRIDIRTHQVHFLGRIDAQLKVRGHRVEAHAVEELLTTQFAEIEAAVLDYRNHELVAFVTAPSLRDDRAPAVAAAPAEWSGRVIACVSRLLPAPSVPSRIFLVREFVSNPVSGKIDRKRLPDLSLLPTGTASDPARAPSAADPQAVAGDDEVLSICREVFESEVLGWDDAFADHGGHSLLIAMLALRLQDAGWKVTVRDLLSERDTARKVSAVARDLRPALARPAETAPSSGGGVQHGSEAEVLSARHFSTLQALFLVLLHAPALLGALGLVATANIGEFFLSAQLPAFILVGFLMYLAALLYPFALLPWVNRVKRLVAGPGGVRPGVYAKWSRAHLRTWCIERLEQSVLRPMRAIVYSPPIIAWVLRRLGARVGRNLQCANDVQFAGPLDLLCIEDDVAIQTGACISTSKWVGQTLHFGPVYLESGCKIGMRSGVADHVRVGRGSWVTPLTSVLADVGPGEIQEGAPARFVGRCTELRRTAHSCRHKAPNWVREPLNVLLQILLDFSLTVMPTAAIACWTASFALAGGSDHASSHFELASRPEIVWDMLLYAFITTWVTIVLVSVLGCAFIRCTPASPGLHATGGLAGTLLLYRMRKLNQIQRLWTWTITGQYLRALAGVGFRRTGGSECDVMINLVPELSTVGAQAFWSHGCFTNMLEHGAHHLTLRQLDMPANFFAGNNSVAESGQLPTNFLLGVSTPGSDIRFRRQSRTRLGLPMTVAGNPPIRVGRADPVAGQEEQVLPGFPLFLGRIVLNDVLSIGLLPITEVPVFAVFYTLLYLSFGHPFLSALAALALTEATVVCAAILAKRILVGSTWGTDHSTPFWSWRHLTYFFAQDCFFLWCRSPMRILSGTLLTNVLLRGMGCRIGKRTLFTDPLQAFDWNAVRVGDDCIIDGLLQLHSFEEMSLRVKRAEIGDGSAVNFGAMVMGGAVIEAGTTLLPLSVVLKAMQLRPAIYEGNPAEPLGPALSGPSLAPISAADRLARATAAT